jgi:hypothetical protein
MCHGIQIHIQKDLNPLGTNEGAALRQRVDKGGRFRALWGIDGERRSSVCGRENGGSGAVDLVAVAAVDVAVNVAVVGAVSCAGIAVVRYAIAAAATAVDAEGAASESESVTYTREPRRR